MTEIRWYEEGKPHMRIKENKGVTWLSYQAFEKFPDIVPCVQHQTWRSKSGNLFFDEP